MTTLPSGRPPLGRSGVSVTSLTFGGAPIGGMFTAVGEDDAQAAMEAAWAGGVRSFDTAPLYGHGLSEERVGRFVAGKPRDEVVVCSKVGRLLRPSGVEGPAAGWADGRGLQGVFDYSADGVRRSFEESLVRLGTDRLDICLVHDPDDLSAEEIRTALMALADLRDQGAVGAIGLGMNQVEVPSAVLDDEVGAALVDCVLVAGRASVLDRSATPFLDRCLAQGVSVLAAGVFNSGLLAGDGTSGTFDYAPPSPEVATRARALATACTAHGVPLPAAALRYPLLHPAVASVVVGTRNAAETAENLELIGRPIPDELWPDLTEAVTGPLGNGA